MAMWLFWWCAPSPLQSRLRNKRCPNNALRSTTLRAHLTQRIVAPVVAGGCQVLSVRVLFGQANCTNLEVWQQLQQLQERCDTQLSCLAGIDLMLSSITGMHSHNQLERGESPRHVRPCLAYWIVTHNPMLTVQGITFMLQAPGNDLNATAVRNLLKDGAGPEDYSNALHIVLKDYNNLWVFNQLGLADERESAPWETSISKLHVFSERFRTVIEEARSMMPPRVFNIQHHNKQNGEPPADSS